MDVARRLRFGLAALIALAASAFFAAPALADTQPDPQLTNIPYLAWRGEEVRIVKCDPDILAGLDAAQRQQVAQSAQFEDIFVDFLLVDWSGDPNVVKPQLEPGTVSMFFRSFDGSPCVAGTVVSQKAGIGQFKLVVTANLSLAVGTPFINVPEVITLKHDFNVAWMNINQATLSVTNGGTTDVAGGAGNELQVLVNGTIPLLSNYGELGLGDHVTMPDDWAALANVMATFRDPLNPNPALMWDIHDGLSWLEADVEGHGWQSACPEDPVAGYFDAVDDCGNLDPFGPFSRIWQFYTNPTLGPFDPQRPQQTLLSNGVLDAGDAPMPAARIDWAIAQNSGAPGDISGVGSLFPQLKFLTYVRDTEHPYYAPFYAFWLPPTYPSLASAFFGQIPPFFVNEASGVTGPVNLSRSTADCAGSVLINGIPTGGGNNFNGFLACGLYLPWLYAKTLQCAPAGLLVDPNDPFGQGCDITEAAPTGCLPVLANTSEDQSGADMPYLDQKTVAYTDEHGEARTLFLPGVDFYFLNLPGVAINANGGCDLANVSVLGSANISATVRYPFEPVTARPVVSNTVTKTVTSAFSKSITCYPKGATAEEQNAAICVAQAIDITGAPFVGETVCFMADFNAEDIQYFAGSIPGTGITIGDEGRNAAAEAQGLRRICPYTDSSGRAAVEIFNTNPTTVDVSALFVDEGILRHLLVPFPIKGQVGPATGVKSSSGNTTPTNTGTGTGTTGTGTGTTGTGTGTTGTGTTGTSSTPSVKVRLVKVKLVRKSRTRATVILRVKGPQGKVPVQFRFHAKSKVRKGSKNTRVARMVRTNKLLKINRLRTPNAKRLVLRVKLLS
jgi:hypothetical protein